MYRIQLDPGPWAQYVKRADNINLPLNEVSKKYMMESNLYATQLFEALQQQQSMQSAVAAAGAGLGTPTIPTTPAPTATPTPTPTPTSTPTPTPYIHFYSISSGSAATGSNACLLTSSFNAFSIQDINTLTTLYDDITLTTLYVGNGGYYKIQINGTGSAYSGIINSTGSVSNINPC